MVRGANMASRADVACGADVASRADVARGTREDATRHARPRGRAA